MPYSRTVGNWGECLVRLRAGQVRTSRPNCLTQRQRADGYVLACVSEPTAMSWRASASRRPRPGMRQSADFGGHRRHRRGVTRPAAVLGGR
ncbi:2Fe-2S iron-sulfur cluster binding domain-containing protein [Streptomyces sp. NPDC003077]|uniref:2Fe-2S iron-sulfur cluster-binding protein n=1 Tax=Streptomyces sp. NPDC003077 TaxID=3154443 RepID=UPI0033A1903A